MENVRVWFVRCKPFNPNNRDSKESSSFQEDCIDDKIFGMGWYDKRFSEHVGKEINDELVNSFRGMKRIGAFTRAQRQYLQMEIGDVVLAKLNKKYYYGKIDSKPILSNDDKFTWCSKVKSWTLYGEYKDLPSHVRGLLSSQPFRNTVAEITGLAALTIKEKAGIVVESKAKLTDKNFVEALGPDDLEDLVAYYMHKNNEGYTFLPSSCKTNTPEIEYIMYNPETDKKICCQTKVNAKIDEEIYKAETYDDFEKIYLFSGEGYRNSCERRIIEIDQKDLFEYFKENKYFTNLVSQYFDVSI